MRRFLYAAALIVIASPAHAGAGPTAAFNAAFGAIGLTKPAVTSTLSAPGVKPNGAAKSYVVMQFDQGIEAPSTLNRTSADRRASAYCRAAKYQLGRALQVSPVSGQSGRFAYFRVDRLICFNDTALPGA